MDIWKWFNDECDRLADAGQAAAARTIYSVVQAATDLQHERVDAAFPEALAVARALGNPWLEIFVRHWMLQSRVLKRCEGAGALGEAVSLVEFAHREEHRQCPQAVCAVQDLAACYGNCDGPGYGEERLAVTRETLARIDPSWPCYRCLTSEYASALIDLGRLEEASDYVAEVRAAVREAGATLDDQETDVDLQLRLGRLDVAEALLESWKPDGRGGEGERLRYRVQHARLQAARGKLDEAARDLPLLDAIEDTPQLYQPWVDAVVRLIAAGRFQNSAGWGVTLRRLASRLSSKGAFWRAFELAQLGVESALDRGASSSAARDLELVRAIQKELRRPERAQPIVERLAARIAAAPSTVDAAASYENADALLGSLADGAVDADARLARIEAGHARWPGDARIATQLAATLLGLDFRDAGEALLRARLAAHPTEGDTARLLGDLLLDDRRHDEVEALAASLLEGPDPTDGHFLLGSLEHARRRFARCGEHFAKVVERNPGALRSRRRWADAARHLGDFPTMLAQLDELVARVPDDPPLHWDRMVAATITGAWDKVRESAVAIGMNAEGSGPIDVPGGPCRIRFEGADGERYDRWARRNSPVTARVIEMTEGDEGQHYQDLVVFDATPLDPPDASNASDAEEERPLTFAAVLVQQSGNHHVFALDGPHPGEAAWNRLVERLEAMACPVQVRSTEGYRLHPPDGGDTVAGVFAMLAVPSSGSPAQVHALLSDESRDHALPLTWANLAAAAGDDHEAAAHRDRLTRYETDPAPDNQR